MATYRRQKAQNANKEKQPVEIAITGPSGVGKTTFTNALIRAAENIGMKVAAIDMDRFYSEFMMGKIKSKSQYEMLAELGYSPARIQKACDNYVAKQTAQVSKENETADIKIYDFYNFSGQPERWQSAGYRLFLKSDPDYRYDRIKARNLLESQSRAEHDKRETAYFSLMKNTILKSEHREIFNDGIDSLDAAAREIIAEIKNKENSKKDEKLTKFPIKRIKVYKHVKDIN